MRTGAKIFIALLLLTLAGLFLAPTIYGWFHMM